MIEKALTGGKRYWAWLALLLIPIGIGGVCYMRQLGEGLAVTGMGRDISWGIYIGQYTFLVGVAASALVVSLSYYLHDQKTYGALAVLGECLAVAAVSICLLFVILDMGSPTRLLYVILYATPGSILFWDVVSLNGLALLSVAVAWGILGSERKGTPPPAWALPLIYLSIPWAVGARIVTALLFANLPEKGLWLTALLVARALASAFAAGPALLIILCLVVRRLTGFDVGGQAVRNLGRIVKYALLATILFAALEFFSAFYSEIPGSMDGFRYLYLDGNLAPWMQSAVALAMGSAVMLASPVARRNEGFLAVACVAVIVAIWIDKVVGLVIGGFIPSPLGRIVEYHVTAPELAVTVGAWAIGLLTLTALCRIAVSGKEKTA
jgi:molybdopterin-containing oxidoreductase family membrane subunit